MATCIRCGTSRFALRTVRCLYCSTGGCDRCMVVFGDIVSPLRRRARQQTVTQVQVDINGLVEQIRKGGLSTTYTCPACKSPIAISGSTSPEALRSCAYCGSTIQTTDLARFLARVVGT